MARSRILPVRPGEGRRLLWLALIGMAYATATSIGDDVAQSVFVSRVGADALPRMFLFKGVLDVVAAALYLPLTRDRSATSVWQVAIGVYASTVLLARIAITGGGELSAYALYVAHECAWTILTIHWGVFILDAFDASQARRLFPILFTAARLGGMLAGTLLQAFARRIGAVDMLFVAAGFAAIAGALSMLGQRMGAGASLVGMRAVVPDADAVPEGTSASGEGDESVSLLAGWRRAAASPLVRAIAISTAAMVLVRYGLQMVSLGTISDSFRHDEDLVASFLGWFGAWANLCGALLGVFVVPRLLARFGVGAVNIIYAVSTALACGGLLMAPGLVVAALARFVTAQFKSAIKTPLSTLFYGAEPPKGRILARAFIFGAIIPTATLSTSLIFELGRRDGLRGVAWIALVVAVVFTIACAVQNRRWRQRLRQLLGWTLERAADSDPERLACIRERLSDDRASASPHERDIVDDAARALAHHDRRVRALGEEVLSETIPRARAHAIARPFVDPSANEPSAQ